MLLINVAYITLLKEEEYEINQHLVGMKELFRGYIIVVWEVTNLGGKKYSVLNKIIGTKWLEFYGKCKKQN